MIRTGFSGATSVATLMPVFAAITTASLHAISTEIRSSIQKISSLVVWHAIAAATAMAIPEVTCVGVCEGTPKATWTGTSAVAAAAQRGRKRGQSDRPLGTRSQIPENLGHVPSLGALDWPWTPDKLP